MNIPSSDIDLYAHTLAHDVHQGNRRALAQAITLVESTHPTHRACAERLITTLSTIASDTHERTPPTIRVGISGAPGVGKSCLIEVIGLHLLTLGHRVAVLAIDPSSPINRGAILADKTRMEKLSASPHAFIRPTPSSGTLGGINAHTREALLLCEAAGFDVILVETVGVGQSEIAVANTTDCFVLLQLPHTGDDLQAIKKGILERADIIAYNKIDIDPLAAQQAMMQTHQALKFIARADPWASASVEVIGISALHNQGIATLWQAILQHHQTLQANHTLIKKRNAQTITWTWDLITQSLEHDFRTHPAVAKTLSATLTAVNQGELTPNQAVNRLIQQWKSS